MTNSLATGSSRSHCVVYLMVEKSFSDGKLEYGKLCLVSDAASASNLCSDVNAAPQFIVSITCLL